MNFANWSIFAEVVEKNSVLFLTHGVEGNPRNWVRSGCGGAWLTPCAPSSRVILPNLVVLGQTVQALLRRAS